MAVACYGAAGATMGVTFGASAPAAVIACNTALGTFDHLIYLKALEPISTQPSSSGKTSPLASDGHQLTPDDFARPDLITSAPAQYAVYGSFPVDVIVYLHMQPSVLRFSCLPVSRVECLLQLPSVDLVFSSKRLQDELDINLPQQPLGKNFPYSTSCGPSRTGNVKHGHKRSASDYRHPQHQTETSIGGLSMTGCLADFSLYIFHPYGGQKKAPGSSISEATSFPNPKSNSDRKDALSLQVEFVKINISRSRRLVLSLETSPPSIIRSSHSSQDKLNQTVMIRFSALCDIGSASFKYDMRRLTETLAFPKAWYRKAIWKRMFLGDQGISGHSIFSDQDYNLSSSSSSSPSTSSSSTSINESGLPTSSIKTSGHFNKSPNSRGRDSLWLNIQDTDVHRSQHASSSHRIKHSHLHSSVSSEGTNQQRRIMTFKKDKGTRGSGIVKPSTPTSTSSGSGLVDSGSPSNEIYRHHRHWQKVLRLVSGASLSTLCNPLPTKGTILGGTFELIGNNISLACFYGINFRSKSWGLFSMLKPSISFASEAQDVVNNETGSSDTHIIQNFTFSLGR
ncbi:bridge-like lipid transfer protein family member 1 [Panonychus citri]|uniref:bridge-like lipid transfer protein family member 1 n=1 Tax=Panonychus citri TaxID=50023 RepID=UPI00230799B0|nr:bridge-like lipid transfer protein family member 1 [Panonychus citri]